MNNAIILEKGVLGYKSFKEPKLQSHSIIMEGKAFGINYDDINVLSGKIINSNQYGIMGIEASGVILEIESNCNRGFQIGDRVCYATYSAGSFVQRRNIKENYLIPIPRYATFEDGATLLKGLMAYTLIGKIFTISPSATIVLSGASGGVGSFFIQLANKIGIKVIGLTRYDNKKDYIKSNGAFEVINYKKQPIVEAIHNITKGKGADCFFDCLGLDVENFAFDILKNKGFFISFGTITGEPTKINLQNQKEKSITVTRASLGHFMTSYEDLMATSIIFFKSMQMGFLKTHITSYSFNDANAGFTNIKNETEVGQKVFTI